jgi:hypothetical protein
MKLPLFLDDTGKPAYFIDNSILESWRQCQVGCNNRYGKNLASGSDVDLYFGTMWHKFIHRMWGTFGQDPWKLDRGLTTIADYDLSMQSEKKNYTRLKNAASEYHAYYDEDSEVSYEEYALSHPTILAEEFLSFPITEFDGIKVYYCGSIDRVVRSSIGEKEVVVIDYKTSTWNRIMDQGWNLSPQFLGYVWLVRNKLNLKVNHFLLDMLFMQSKVDNKFYRRQMEFEDWMINEWEWMRREEILTLLETPESHLTNKNSCSDYKGCIFYPLCSNDPRIREELEEMMYEKKVWTFNREMKLVNKEEL